MMAELMTDTRGRGDTMIMTRILGLGGGLREGSYSLVALRETLAIAEARGAATHLLDLNELPLPLYRPDYDSPLKYGPEAAARIARLLEAARWADGHLWASPAYHGALSGAMKNALDYLQFLGKDEPSYLYGKTIGLISAGGGAIAPINVVTQLTQIAHALRAQVVPLAVPITAAYKAFDGGQLTDAQVRGRLDALGTEIVALAAAHAARRLVTA